jgi:hypothetical protein
MERVAEIDDDVLALFDTYRREAIALSEALAVSVSRHPELPFWFADLMLRLWARVDEATLGMTCTRCERAIAATHLGLDGMRCAGCAVQEAA